MMFMWYAKLFTFVSTLGCMLMCAKKIFNFYDLDHEIRRKLFRKLFFQVRCLLQEVEPSLNSNSSVQLAVRMMLTTIYNKAHLHVQQHGHCIFVNNLNLII